MEQGCRHRHGHVSRFRQEPLGEKTCARLPSRAHALSPSNPTLTPWPGLSMLVDKYKEWLGLPNTVGNVERVYRLPERLATANGPPTCVSIEDAADFDVEQGTSASAGVGWEGRTLRWAVLERCAKATADGVVDITSSIARYNSSGTVKLGSLPRDGTLLLLQYGRPRNVDPYAQLKGFKKFTTHANDDAAARAARAAAATKFIVFSRARSASTTFITALNAHPNVSCGYEYACLLERPAWLQAPPVHTMPYTRTCSPTSGSWLAAGFSRRTTLPQTASARRSALTRTPRSCPGWASSWGSFGRCAHLWHVASRSSPVRCAPRYTSRSSSTAWMRARDARCV